VQPVGIRGARTAELLRHVADVARTQLEFHASQMPLDALAVGLDGPNRIRSRGYADGEAENEKCREYERRPDTKSTEDASDLLALSDTIGGYRPPRRQGRLRCGRRAYFLLCFSHLEGARFARALLDSEGQYGRWTALPSLDNSRLTA
jgi:hypothetical protein